MGRFIVVIAEGLAATLLARWRAHLPALNHLTTAGATGCFRSLPVPYEPSALLSAFTGAPPGEHGCFSYWQVHGERFDTPPPLVVAEAIGAPFLWQRPAAAAIKVGIVNLFGTHPPQPVNGHLISYPLNPTLKVSYPPNLTRDLLRAGIRATGDFVLYTGQPRAEFVERLLTIERERVAACNYLLAKGGDLFIFNLSIMERLSHFWWGETALLADEETALWQAYQLIDRYLGELQATLQPTDHLLLFSEIGFGPLRQFVSVNDLLVKAGMLTLTADGQIDAQRSLVMETPQGSHGLTLNLQRRYADGLIADRDEEARLREVGDFLATARNPFTGEPLFAEIVRGCDLYPGSHTVAAPDLVLLPYNEQYLPLGHHHWAQKMHRHRQTGWHRRETVWGGMGPRFTSPIQTATPYDIAHTLADYFDLPLATAFGHSLLD